MHWRWRNIYNTYSSWSCLRRLTHLRRCCNGRGSYSSGYVGHEGTKRLHQYIGEKRQQHAPIILSGNHRHRWRWQRRPILDSKEGQKMWAGCRECIRRNNSAPALLLVLASSSAAALTSPSCSRCWYHCRQPLVSSILSIAGIQVIGGHRLAVAVVV